MKDRRSSQISLGLVLFLWVSGCTVPGQSINFDAADFASVAVKVRDPKNLCRTAPSVLQTIEGRFHQQLLRYGYSIPTRSTSALKALQEEQEFQNFQRDDDTSTAVELGRVLAVPIVLLVDVTATRVDSERRKYQVKTFSSSGKPRSHTESRIVHTARGGMSAQLLDVHTGEVLWVFASGASCEVSDPHDKMAALADAAQNVARKFPNRLKRLKELEK